MLPVCDHNSPSVHHAKIYVKAVIQFNQVWYNLKVDSSIKPNYVKLNHWMNKIDWFRMELFSVIKRVRFDSLKPGVSCCLQRLRSFPSLNFSSTWQT